MESGYRTPVWRVKAFTSSKSVHFRVGRSQNRDGEEFFSRMFTLRNSQPFAILWSDIPFHWI